ncbi:MAG: leucine-rich repeat domain-containing protein [Oscillospiraceae bacterium]
MSMEITNIYDFYIAQEYRRFVSEVFRQKSWYEFPSPDIWEKLDSGEDSAACFFPFTGLWQESTGRISFTGSFNHYSHPNAGYINDIFCQTLPQFSEPDRPFYYSFSSELDEDDEVLLDLNSNLRAEHLSAEPGTSPNQAAAFVIRNETLYPPENPENIGENDSVLRLNLSDMLTENGTLIIPAGVKRIAPRAFAGADIRRAVIPAGVESIGASAFEGCTGLESVELPHTLCEIAERAFCTSGLQSVALPDATQRLNPYTFFGCIRLKSIQFGVGLKYIGKRAFAFCPDLSEVNLPMGIRELHGGAFCKCPALEKVAVPAGLEFIGFNAFSGCGSLSGLYIPPSVRYIGDEQKDDRFNTPDGQRIYGPFSSDVSVFPEDKDGFTLSGAENSAAHYYALFHNLEFEIIG